EAAPGNPWVWFARGRAYQQQATLQWVKGEDATPLLQRALKDYERADELTQDGRILFCLGFCHSLLPNHKNAVVEYQRAIQAGFVAAEVFNNLGYSYLQLGKPEDLTEAHKCLTQALDCNPNLVTRVAAYRNRAWVRFRQDLQSPDIESIIDDIKKAVELSPPSPETSELSAD